MRRVLPLVVGLVLLLSFVGRPTTGSRATGTTQPILLVVNSAAQNPFGAFTGEILRTEGIASYTTVELTSLTSAQLNEARLVILTETSLSSGQAALLNSYAAGGGKLIAMRPDAQLNASLGLSSAGATTTNGYIAINTGTSTGAGFTATTLPYRGTANHYTLAAGASAIATLYSGQTTATAYPAVVRYNNTVTWSYDLARSVAYTRQGLPANAGVNRDGLPPVRTNDVFYQAIDLDRVAIPHADIQMRLLSRLISDLLAETDLPLPRLWYFPDAKRTLMILTGDAHGNLEEQFQNEMNSINSYGANISLYLAPGVDRPSLANVNTWRGQGHEFGVHPYGAENNQSLNAGYQQAVTDFTSRFGTPSRTARNHQVEWAGWVDAAKVEAAYNIGLDTNFYTWGPAVTYPNGSQAHGYITGSALPMRFVDELGEIVPVYQQVTSLIDEQLLPSTGSNSENLTASQALAVAKQLIDASQAGDYAAIMTQFHIDYYGSSTTRSWAEGTMSYAQQLGIPMWSAEHWLRYLEQRDAATISAVAWSSQSHTLSFDVTLPAGAEAHSILIPRDHAGLALVSATIDGAPAVVTQQAITGRAASFISVGAGTHTIVASYNTPPTPTITPTPSKTSTRTPTIVPGSELFPKTSVLDTFNQADGPLATSWTGARSGYSLVGGRLTVQTGGPIYCCGTYGVDQEVFVNYTAIPGSAQELDLMLKVQNGDWSSGAIEVIYVPLTNVVQVWTFTPGTGWQQLGTNIPVTLNTNDQLGARALGSLVELYHNGNLIGTRSIANWPFVNQGGTIGLWAVSANGATFDNFGGGTYNGGTPTPTRTRTATVTRTATRTATGTATPVITGTPPTEVPTLTSTATPTVPTATPSNTATSTPTPKPAGNASFVHTTAADFACAIFDGAMLTQQGNGELRLAGTSGDEYGAASLSSTTWSWGSWSVGTYNPMLSNDQLVILGGAGAYVRSASALPVTTLEFSADFGAAPWQHVGWAGLDFADNRYMIFSTFNGGSTLYARTNNAGSEQRADLGALPVGLHHYRITRTALGNGSDQISYYVDGTLRAQHTVATQPNLYIYQSYNGGTSGALRVERIWAYPSHVTGGSVESCTLDAGSSVTWSGASWTLAAGSAGGVQLQTRSSSDGTTWSGWSAPLANGQDIPSPDGRYLQYRLSLTGSSSASPIVDAVTISYLAPPPTATPTASSTPAPTLTATPAPTSTPRPAGNASITHATFADFACATFDGAILSRQGDGELRLAGSVGDEYSAAPLSAARWSWGSWSVGTYDPMVSNGQLVILGGAGAYVRSANALPVTTLEFSAEFGAAPWQHVGWAGLDFADGRYLIFSTFNGSNLLYARSADGNSEQRVSLGALPVGLHHYRITRTALGNGSDLIGYYVDGALLAQHTVATEPNLYIYQSYNGGTSSALRVDRIWAYPSYTTAGSVESCTVDAGASVTWGQASWALGEGSAGSVTLQTRSSSDGTTWSGWSAPLASGQDIASPDGRYLQYRLNLTGSGSSTSPIVDAVTLGYTALPPTATPTASSTPAPTLTPTVTPTSTPKPAGNASITHATAADFSCLTYDNAMLTRQGDGELRLAGAAGDEYSAAPLSAARWSWGSWSVGTYDPMVSNGQLVILGGAGAYVRSANALPVTTLEFSAEFGAAPWQHVGWAGLDFADGRYLIFSTFNGGSTLYARSADGNSEQRADLGALPVGLHHYRITRTALGNGSDLIDYYVDGALLAQHTITAQPNLYIYQSYNGGTSSALRVDRIWAYPSYVTGGSVESCTVDAGASVTWSQASWALAAGSAGSATLQTRSSSDGTTWSGWSAPLASGQDIASPDGRYLQYRLNLTGSGSASPIVDAVTISYAQP